MFSSKQHLKIDFDNFRYNFEETIFMKSKTVFQNILSDIPSFFCDSKENPLLGSPTPG